MRTSLPVLMLVGLLGLAACLPLPAAAQGGEQLKSARILTEGFLRHHPDIEYRLAGLDHLDQGEHAEALSAFRRASRYADKVSQAMVAELLWAGAVDGVDRAAGYAWMDLAAERGYAVFVAKREQYWKAMDAAQRERAIAVGKQIYAEYGDEVAKPRLETLLNRGRWAMTGSRVGFKGALEIRIPGPGGQWVSLSGDEYYDDKLWKPEAYFAWQDRTWGGQPVGTVSVGELGAEGDDPAQE